MSDIIPFVEKHYRTLPGRENRAIAGLSMGSGIAMNVGLKRLDVFASVGIMSSGTFGRAVNGVVPGAMLLEQISPGFFADPAATNKKLRLLFFSCGTEDNRIESLTKVEADLQRSPDQLHVQALPGRARVEGLAPFARRHGADAVPIAGRDAPPFDEEES